MKRYLILFLFCQLTALSALAQELTVEYNVGFGTYKMGNLKEFMENTTPQLQVNNVKVTDNFPGFITHQAKLGVEWKKLHQAGLLLDYMNTVSNKGVSDYSASYNITFRVKGLRLGGFYRFALPDFSESLVRPYLQLSTGVVFNDGKFSEGVEFSNGLDDKASQSLGGANFFIEPAVGAKIRVHKRFALNVNVGYEFDISKKFKYEGQSLTIAPDWSGLRLQGGIIYYIPLTSK
jgi:hypothetical protein